jgi:hypothetical protein
MLTPVCEKLFGYYQQNVCRVGIEGYRKKSGKEKKKQWIEYGSQGIIF